MRSPETLDRSLGGQTSRLWVGCLTALAALVVVAAVGSETASATVLCTVAGPECPSGATYPAETEIKGTGEAEINTSVGAISCATSSLTAITSEKEGKPLQAEVTALTFNSCFISSVPCTIEAEGLPYSSPIEYLGGVVASLTLEEPNFYVKCGFFINCTYSASEPELALEGESSSPAIRAAAVELTRSGKFCPKEGGTFSATYNVEQPPLFPGAARVPGTVMCQQNVPPAPCRNVYAVPQTFKGELEAEVKFPFVYGGVPKQPACKISTVEGKTTTNGSPLVGELTALTFGECSGGLCNIEALRLPYRVEMLDGTPDTMTWSSGGNGQPAFRITGCPGAMECTYGVSSIGFNVTGGGPAKFVKPTSVSLGKEAPPLSEATCSATAKWEGVAGAGGEIKYKFTLPNPLYLVS